MKIHGRTSYSKAVILTAERVWELESMLRKHCTAVKYEISTFSGIKLEFQAMDELLEYDNFKKKRIRTLRVLGFTKCESVVEMTFLSSNTRKKARGYHETCICDYTFKNMDSQSIFREDMADFFDKCTAPYWIWGKLPVCFVPLFLGCLYVVCSYFAGKFSLPMINGRIGITVIIAPLLLISFPLGHVIHKVFPPVVFLWGEEIQRNGRYEKFRNNFWWGGIVAVCASLLASLLHKCLFPF